MIGAVTEFVAQPGAMNKALKTKEPYSEKVKEMAEQYQLITVSKPQVDATIDSLSGFFITLATIKAALKDLALYRKKAPTEVLESGTHPVT